MSRQRPHAGDCACFGCKVAAVGVQTLAIRHGSNPKEHVPVIREEGPGAGTVGGYHTKHWDGRQDATVLAEPTIVTTRVQGA